MTKRLTIELYGHLRTYQNTYQSLFEHIVLPNQKDGYEVDIFIHTWDKLETDEKTWHDENSLIAGIKVDDKIKNDIMDKYNPKILKIETLKEKHGARLSIDAVNNLREKYEKEHNIKYNKIITTRGDILFYKPFALDYYLDIYLNNEELRTISKPKNLYMFASSGYNRFPLIDIRYIPEYDLFQVYCNLEEDTKCDIEHCSVLLNYILYKDFDILRVGKAKTKSEHKISYIRLKKNIMRETIKILPYFIAKKLLEKNNA